MKKAVITTGGKQYIVAEGDELNIETMKSGKKSAEFDALLVYDGDEVNIGKPVVGSKVTADVLEQEVAQEKVTSIRYKAKKRVRSIKGHRQKLAKIKIKKIN